MAHAQNFMTREDWIRLNPLDKVITARGDEAEVFGWRNSHTKPRSATTILKIKLRINGKVTWSDNPGYIIRKVEKQ